MPSTTDTQFSPLQETFGETLTQLAEGAAELARESTKSYVTALNAMVQQQKLAYEASQQWISGVASAQSNIRRQLVQSYESGSRELVKATEEATQRAGEASAEVAERSSDVIAAAAHKQRTAVAKTPRRRASTGARSGSRASERPGPAKWTSQAYEELTAAELIEQLSKLSQRELGEVEAYERAHQSRQTVLQKVDALRGEEPVPGYDELNVQEIHKQLSDGDDDLAARVRDYERPRKHRDGVLNAAEAQLTNS